MSTLKTIRQHWESLPNKKLGEWLMKQPLVCDYYTLDTIVIDEFDALYKVSWINTGYRNQIEECYYSEHWQPLLDALPELREGEVSDAVQPQQDRIEQLETEIRKLRTESAIKEGKEVNQRRSEIVQLVAAMASIDGVLRDNFEYLVGSAILLQSEIDQQLNQR